MLYVKEWETSSGRGNMEDLGIDDVKKQGMEARTGFDWLRIEVTDVLL